MFAQSCVEVVAVHRKHLELCNFMIMGGSRLRNLQAFQQFKGFCSFLLQLEASGATFGSLGLWASGTWGM